MSLCPSVSVSVPFVRVQNLTPVFAFGSQNVNNRSFLVCVKSEKYALLLGKLEAYSVLESMYLWLHITWITKESSQRRVLGQYMSLGRF